MDTTGWTLLCGCAPFANFLFCARERDDIADQGIAASAFYVWDEEDHDPSKRWMIYSTVVNWRAQSMATIKPPSGVRVVVAIGTRGQFWELEPLSLKETEGIISGARGPMRQLTAIDHVVIAVGMGRTVLRRDGLSQWTEIGPGTTAKDADRIVGFEGIDGRGLDDFYTVGWAGEIWHRTNGAWKQIDSPTTANLNAVACSSDGSVYAVGDNGSMVVGTDDRWQFVDTGRTENLQDIAEFGGEVFVVTDFKILRLTDQGLLPEDRFVDDDVPSTCLHLLRAEDGIVSLGPKDLFRFSGTAWERIV